MAQDAAKTAQESSKSEVGLDFKRILVELLVDLGWSFEDFLSGFPGPRGQGAGTWRPVWRSH